MISYSSPANNTAKVLWNSSTDFSEGTLSASVEMSGTGDAAVLRLKEMEDASGNIDYTTTSDYTASSSSIQVANGQAELAEILPEAVTFYANYTSSIDATYSAGTGTGTAVGGASVSGGKLALNSNDTRYVAYPGASNGDHAQIGTIRLKYTPAYSGSPSGNAAIFTIGAAEGVDKNRLELRHASNGALVLGAYSTTTPIIDFVSLGTWSPTSGTEYELEVNYNFDAGATRVFINGTQFGSTQTATGTRDTDITVIRVGSTIHNGQYPSNALFDGFTIFDAVQHTGNYTVANFFPTTDNLYVETEAGSDYAPTQVAAWLTATFTSSTPSNTDIRVLFSNDGRSTWKTWNGSAWAAPSSATTRTDATTIANAQTNFASLAVGSGTIDVRLFLYTSDGISSPTVSNIAFTSDSGYETSGTFTTNVFDSGNESQDWGTLSLTSVTPTSTSFTVKARASNDSSSFSDYGSSISNHGNLSVSGRYLQIQVTFTGVLGSRPILQAVGATFNPIVGIVNP